MSDPSGVGTLQWLANKSAPSKGIFLEHLFRFQSALPVSQHRSYVVTHDAVKDASMVRHMRIADTIAKSGPHASGMRASLKVVYMLAAP
jgi:hypothetical protein